MRVEHIGEATLYLGDCLEVMRGMPDKAFDLAIVDPPYGDAGGGSWQDKPRSRFGGWFDKYEIPPRTVNHAFGGRFGRYTPEGCEIQRNVGREVRPERRPP